MLECACRAGTITATERSGAPFNLHAHRDTFSSEQLYDLPEDKRFAADYLNGRQAVIGCRWAARIADVPPKSVP